MQSAEKFDFPWTRTLLAKIIPIYQQVYLTSSKHRWALYDDRFMSAVWQPLGF